MYASVFNMVNTAGTDQEVTLFDTSDQGSGSGESIIYTFQGTIPAGVTAVWNRATSLFYDQTLVANAGEVGVDFTRKTGGVSTFRTSVALANLPLADFVGELNSISTPTDPGNLGTWTGELIDPLTNEFKFTLTMTYSDVLKNNIDLNATNYGLATPLNFRGLGWTPAAITGTSNGLVVSNNPNITISSYSDFSYSQFLWSITQRTYDVKNFQIWSPNQSQLLEPFLFDRKTATGKKFQKVLTPTVDPYQDQNYVITPENKGYILDGFTSIKYKLKANATVRLILDYTFIDSSTPLVAKVVSPEINKDFITPVFVSNMEKGFTKFGCDFLLKRSKVLSDKLRDVAGSDGTQHPKWQEQLRSKLMYIKQMMIMYECMDKREIEELPEFEMIGTEYRRLNLWMPSPEFVQAQLDSEQGARKLFDKFDFPIVKE